MTRRTPRKTNVYVGLGPDELAIVEGVQRDTGCSTSQAIRTLIRTAAASQIASPRLTVEKENEQQ
jgi:hypothetical protein